MKSDLDRLMAARDLRAVLVVSFGHYENPVRHYLTGGVQVGTSLVIKKHGADPVMIVNPMETEEAAHSGLKVYSNYDMGWVELLKQAENDATKATVAFWGNCLQKLEVPAGKIGIYGTGDINYFLELVRLVEKAFPQYQFVGEMGLTLFDEAAVTKDADEMKRVRSIANRTSETLQATWDFIAAHHADGDVVVKAGGAPLTIGDVRRFVRRALLERELEDTGMIFAQGRDGGFPHSRGEDDMPLKLGAPIVFDLFPRELGGGYHHDTTRTWCIGYAPEPVRRAYETVMEAFDIAVETYSLNKPAHTLQDAVLDYFESKGHPTLRSHPGTTTGYVHGLGHGVGLKIHERPSISHIIKDDKLEIGNVITIEPGLYYPDDGFGVRVEDSFAVMDDGQLVSLTSFHKELVLPLNPANQS